MPPSQGTGPALLTASASKAGVGTGVGEARPHSCFWSQLSHTAQVRARAISPYPVSCHHEANKGRLHEPWTPTQTPAAPGPQTQPSLQVTLAATHIRLLLATLDSPAPPLSTVHTILPHFLSHLSLLTFSSYWRAALGL